MIDSGSASRGEMATPLMWRLWTIIRGKAMNKIPPVHPGEVLFEEFLKPMWISRYRLAKDINISARRIHKITHGTRTINTNMTLRLARCSTQRPYIGSIFNHPSISRKNAIRSELSSPNRSMPYPCANWGKQADGVWENIYRNMDTERTVHVGVISIRYPRLKPGSYRGHYSFIRSWPESWSPWCST